MDRIYTNISMEGHIFTADVFTSSVSLFMESVNYERMKERYFNKGDNRSHSS